MSKESRIFAGRNTHAPGLAAARFTPTPVALIIAGTFGLGAAQALATPTVFNDSYTLSTSNQSMWGSGGQNGWSYDSGFQGGKWGTFAGSSPVSQGVNAISGSANTVIIPAIPEVCVWGGACIPGTPAVTADTRTGAAVNLKSSGQVGVSVDARASGGSVSVTLPVTTKLTIGDTVNGVFHVGGTSALGAGSRITADAPSFQAGVDGIINMNNSIGATGCFIGAGCSTSSANANLNPGKFDIVGLNTASTKPVSAFGLDTPIATLGQEYAITSGGTCATAGASQSSVQPCGKGPFAAPAIALLTPNGLQDFSGGSVAGGVLSVSNNQTVLKLTADLTGILQTALGFPIDVLNPSIDLLGLVSVSGSLINVQAGVNLGMTQDFSLDPSMRATLLFDKPVSQWIPGVTVCSSGPFVICHTNPGAWVDMGTSVTVDLDSGADLKFTGDIGTLLSRTYSVADTTNFHSSTSLSIDPTLPIRAGCFDLEISGLGGTGNQCAFSDDFHTTGLLDIDVYSTDYALRGFDTASFLVANGGGAEGAEGGTNGNTNVPEPSSVWLALLALAGLAGTRRRKPGQDRPDKTVAV